MRGRSDEPAQAEINNVMAKVDSDLRSTIQALLPDLTMPAANHSDLVLQAFVHGYYSVHPDGRSKPE